MMTLEDTQNQYLDGRHVFTASEESSGEVDREVRKILDTCHSQAKELLEGRRDKLSEIAEYLVSKETITGATFMKLLNKEAAA
jgi:cell division protease FtsH